MSDLVTFGKFCIVHGSRIPQDEVTGLHIDLEQLATTLLEPFDIFLVEEEQVHVLQLWRRRVLVVISLPLLREKLIEQLCASSHEHQPAVLWSVGSVVEETLHGLHALALGVLIAMWPGGPADILTPGHADVHAVEGAEELVGFPELLEDLNDSWFHAGLPCHLFVR